MSNIRIQEINISLWDKYTVSFIPNPDVNIIVGINGSGKTTLLREIDKSLAKTYGKGDFYIYIPSIDNLLVRDSRKKTNAMTQALDTYLYDMKTGPSLMYYRMSMLDAPFGLQNKVKERIALFCEVINDLFQDTDKRVEIEGNKFIINSNGSLLTTDDLSSGEKQILLLLLRIFLLNEKESVVLIDEPENSLDISWQYKLIDLLIKLNPNAQFFITTHSPSIFGNGWGDKIIYMEDVTTKIEKEA
ncbi:MAG: ATP-binding protein [Muribaculaceae bacterium]|nr:ATP-binding protein [Muribaculaceae bacterium]MDE6753566.1 ATP-binding protein [Muribaculaceae bacterium]